ncbi:hypothetical protein [Pseudoxanthomonas sp. CF385]|uniref:hypothetical protein n=1 Tax=Pseudoxanthomonas sp. CF385 TaxID=1881042 RepID=UPI000B89BF2F|nr:hypothetical protein [Pseudoxanthomonas sp. CF385]
MTADAFRIYADFNGLVRGPANGRIAVVLDTFGSLRDLSNAGVVLKDGLDLVAYDESDDAEDIEIHGVARYDFDRQWWVIESDEKGVMYVPAVDRTRIEPGFHCVQCGYEIAGLDAFTLDQACSQCHTPVKAATAAPASTSL